MLRGIWVQPSNRSGGIMMARLLLALVLGALLNSQVYGALAKEGLYWVQGSTQTVIESVSVTEPTRVRLAYSQIAIGGGPVNGSAILARGVDTYSAVALGAAGNYVDLPAGEYSLLAYADLGLEPVAELLLNLQTDTGNVLYNESLSARKILFEEDSDSVTVQQPFVVDNGQSQVEFRYTGFEQFDVADLFADIAFPVVLITDSDEAIVATFPLTSHSMSDAVTLPVGTYSLTIAAALPDVGASGFFWQLQVGEQRYGDKVNLKADNVPNPPEVIALGETDDFAKAQYLLESVWLLGAGNAAYGVTLEQGDNWFTLSPENEHVLPATLEGSYQMYISHPGGENAGVGIKIKRRDDGITQFSTCLPVGNVRLIGEFQVNSPEVVSIYSDDLEFVNSVESVRYAVTDGAYGISSQVVYGDSQIDVPIPTPGTYCLLGQAIVVNNGNALLRSRVVSGSSLLGEGYLNAGEGLVLIQNLEVARGTYRLALADHSFPEAASAVAIGLYGEENRYRKYYPNGLIGMAGSGDLTLAAGTYQLAYLVLTDAEESALLGYALESVEDSSSDPQPDRNANGGGDGGGGSGGAFNLFFLAFLLGMRIARVS